jgi:hypothetical protein
MEDIKIVIFTKERKIIIKDVNQLAYTRDRYCKVNFKHSEPFLIIDVLNETKNQEWLKNYSCVGLLYIENWLINRDLLALEYISDDKFRTAEDTVVLSWGNLGGGE